MAQTANSEDVTTGTEAFDYVRDNWQNLGLGMVEMEYKEPYLEVSRGGGDWTLYLPVTDDEAVLIPHDAINGGPTTRHIPEEFRAEGEVSEETAEKLQRAFDGAGGGAYPLEDGFSIAFKDGDERLSLLISHTDGAVTVEVDA